MFEYTENGYLEAMKWLAENHLEHLIEKELSIDGYTIVHLANTLKKGKDESNNSVL